jgi:formyl-CoA transferase
VALDWANPVAAGALDALLGSAEILVADREGLLRLYAALQTVDLRDRFPRLTVCACTLFGVEGPMATWTGGEEIVQAAGGIMSITGHPGTGPTRVAGAPLTHAAAMFAVTSALADVRRKRAGHAAGMLDVTVYDAAIAFQSASLPAYFLSGTPPQGIGNRHSMSVPWNSFRCADGWVIICAGNHPNWVRLCELIGRPELLQDPRYGTQEGRIAHVDALEAEVTAWTRIRGVAEVEAMLNANTIAGGSVLSLHDVVAHDQFRARNLIDGRSGGRQSGGVFHVDREPLDIREGAWSPGAGTRSMLVDRCHVKPAEYERWLASGAVREAQGMTHVEPA